MRPVPNESKIPVGTVLLGKYKVIREIGRGGMAAVYEAEQMTLGKRVAIKVLASELSNSNIVIERFFREARAAAAIRSPHIVDVYDSGRLEDGRPFIATEYLEGESLYDRMARVRLIDPETAVRVIAQCAKGLAKAHAAGIVHRDLKPENIFLQKGEEGDEIAKILDFGLAKFYSPVATDEKSARLTREGAVFGTPAYMSPEQVKGQGNVDHRADLWALGCMAFECLIGRPVWNTDQGVAMTFAAIATSAIPVPSEIRKDLPKEFDAWFAKALERDPANRFQSAKELAAALQRAFGGHDVKVSFLNISELEEIEAHLDEPAARPLGDGPSDESGLNPIPLTNVASAPVVAPSAPSVPQPSAAEPRAQQPSEVPLATAAAPPPARERPSALRWTVSTIALLGSAAAAFWVWQTQLRPQVLTPLVVSTATTPAPPSSSGTAPTPANELPKWAATISEAQKAFAEGDPQGAQKKLKDAQEQGAPSALVKTITDQLKAAAAGSGPCKVVAYGHPRLPGTSNVSRPTVASGIRGPIVAWSDDHEQAGHDHVYSVVLDDQLRVTTAPRDLTPEGSEVARAVLLPSGDRTVLLYWDRSGREAGVRVRWLDVDGRIAGASTLVGAGRPGQYWPAIDRTPEGFIVAWQDDRDKEGDDLFARRLGPELDTVGPEVRLTDYAGPLGKGPNVRVPVVAVASNALFVGFKLERDNLHLAMRLRIALDDPTLAKGLEDPKFGVPKKDRELGDVKLVNEDKLPADAPAIGCGNEGCFLAWHNEQGGASAALIDPAHGKVIWRKKFAPNGGRPSIGVSNDGQVYVAFYEKGAIKIAPLTRDGLGAVSTFGKVSGEQPRATIASARTAGEWYVTWQDAETFHSEVNVVRLVCK